MPILHTQSMDAGYQPAPGPTYCLVSLNRLDEKSRPLFSFNGETVVLLGSLDEVCFTQAIQEATKLENGEFILMPIPDPLPYIAYPCQFVRNGWVVLLASNRLIVTPVVVRIL